MKKIWSYLLLTVLFISQMTVAQAKEHEDIYIPKIDHLSDDFVMGMDISSVESLEKSGVVFYDEEGQEADLFELLKSSGITHVRIRIWNDPFDKEGRGYGGGNNDVETALRIGQRASKAGLKVLLNFHYSDFWADPGKQKSPKAWEGLSFEDKKEALYRFTSETVSKMLDAGVDVDMVQIGNETNNMMAGEKWDKAIDLMKMGSQAVRDIDEDISVALHFTNPEREGFYKRVAEDLSQREVDYDIFASSYYPFWHGSIENLVQELDDISNKYDKQVLVVETSYPYTEEDGDGHPNTSPGEGQVIEYPISPQGQVLFLHDLISEFSKLGSKALGVFYWEGAWIPVGSPEDFQGNSEKWNEFGSGWASKYAAEYDPDDAGKWFGGTAVDNQAFFDFNGRALPSLKVFKKLKEGLLIDEKIIHVATPVLTYTEDEEIILPETLKVKYNTGKEANVPVIWEEPVKYQIGKNKIKGLLDGIEIEMEVQINKKNFIQNPGFEAGELSWTILYLNEHEDALEVRKENVYDGEKALNFWSDETIEVVIQQDLEGQSFEPALYDLSLQAQGDTFGKSIKLCFSDKNRNFCEEFVLDGWNQWKNPKVSTLYIPQDAEGMKVSIHLSLDANAWGSIDEVVLEKSDFNKTFDVQKILELEQKVNETVEGPFAGQFIKSSDDLEKRLTNVLSHLYNKLLTEDDLKKIALDYEEIETEYEQMLRKEDSELIKEIEMLLEQSSSSEHRDLKEALRRKDPNFDYSLYLSKLKDAVDQKGSENTEDILDNGQDVNLNEGDEEAETSVPLGKDALEDKNPDKLDKDESGKKDSLQTNREKDVEEALKEVLPATGRFNLSYFSLMLVLFGFYLINRKN